MKKPSWIISKYLLQNILPYFIFSWLLISVILFFQQASRFSDIFFNTFLPKNLVWQLTFALIPNVIAFTAPMAVLIGVIIGLSKMQGDSELISIRAAGVGNLQISIPIIILGLLLSLFAFFINLKGVPFAAQVVRKVALQTALYKLESPLEPGVFNTEIKGFTIYVKQLNFEKGTWENVFIFNETPDGQVRLITAKNGRIDNEGEDSELVLENAHIASFNFQNANVKTASEKVGEFRLGIKTKRGELIEKLARSESAPEELGLYELNEYAKNLQGQEKIEAQILWQRRLILSITPFILALLGTALVLRFNSRGKGFGIFLALVSLVAFYLVTLLSEQLARTGTIDVLTAGYIPILLSFLVIFAMFLSNRYLLKKTVGRIEKSESIKFPKKISRVTSKSFYIDLTTGILDFDVITNLIKYFLLTVSFLAFVYLIFTAFELWKFAGTINNGLALLIKYLIYLLPYVYIQLAPSAVMVAVLATYIIKSRRNEIVTWTAAGQSIYRLLFPCFIVMFLVGVINWSFQEILVPDTNRIQDNLRQQIRSRGILAGREGKIWTSHEDRIFSFEMKNEKQIENKVDNLSVYEFTEDRNRIKHVYKSSAAVWDENKITFLGNVQKFSWNGETAELRELPGGEISESSNPFGALYNKPSHLSSRETLEKIKATENEDEKRNFEIALEKKHATFILPFVITLFTAPFAMSLSRKSKVVTIGYAIGIWLLFMGIGNLFEQLGVNGYLSPFTAVWSPLLAFAIFGIYLLTKIRT